MIGSRRPREVRQQQMKTAAEYREARTTELRLGTKWNSNNNGDYEDNAVIDGLRTAIRQKVDL